MSGQVDGFMKTIVVATDFSERTDRAFGQALTMAQRFGASVVLVHGIETISGLQEDSSEELAEFYERLHERAEEAMAGQIERARALGVTARPYVAVGPRWRVILDCAESEDADLIVVGRRSYGDQTSLPVGTTSQRVYFASRRPVLLVPSISI